MKEGIDVTGIPGPNPMLGCGIILFVVGMEHKTQVQVRSSPIQVNNV